MPAPIAPWMSASDALTIWMLSTAMKAPSVEPPTAIHIFNALDAAGREADAPLAAGARTGKLGEITWAVMADSIGLMAQTMPGYARRDNRGRSGRTIQRELKIGP